ncbi:unnamed protein product [Owenia fusiformis]|uniref:Uncharacterized protein n=1 Tax=Owenia fusiformis TaxID=6347 RepID=A0A8J1XSX6_OWEFU|nr:unnamed protein product [Owenia fusiformis]
MADDSQSLRSSSSFGAHDGRKEKYHEGWLEHKPQNKNQWTKYWVVLKGDQIFIFKNKSTQNPDNLVGMLPLGKDTECKNGTDGKKGPYKLEVIVSIFGMQNKRLVNKFKCEQRNDRDLWKAYIIGLGTGSLPSDLDLLPGHRIDVQKAIDDFHYTDHPPALPGRRPSLTGSMGSGTMSSPKQNEGDYINTRGVTPISPGRPQRVHSVSTPGVSFDSSSGGSAANSMQSNSSDEPYMKHKFWNGVDRAGTPAPSWFFERCSRDQAESILTNNRRYGSVLLRESTTFRETGSYVVSWRRVTGGNAVISHYEVQRVAEGFKLNIQQCPQPQRCLWDIMQYFLDHAGLDAVLFTENNLNHLDGITDPPYEKQIFPNSLHTPEGFFPPGSDENHNLDIEDDDTLYVNEDVINEAAKNFASTAKKGNVKPDYENEDMIEQFSKMKRDLHTPAPGQVFSTLNPAFNTEPRPRTTRLHSSPNIFSTNTTGRPSLRHNSSNPNLQQRGSQCRASDHLGEFEELYMNMHIADEVTPDSGETCMYDDTRVTHHSHSARGQGSYNSGGRNQNSRSSLPTQSTSSMNKPGLGGNLEDCDSYLEPSSFVYEDTAKSATIPGKVKVQWPPKLSSSTQSNMGGNRPIPNRLSKTSLRSDDSAYYSDPCGVGEMYEELQPVQDDEIAPSVPSPPAFNPGAAKAALRPTPPRAVPPAGVGGGVTPDPRMMGELASTLAKYKRQHSESIYGTHQAQ